MITTAEALVSLRPGIEWTMDGNDVEGITWHTPGVVPLTTDEVEAEMLRLEQAAVDADAAKIALRASAEKKLVKLGLSIEEITAVLTP